MRFLLPAGPLEVPRMDSSGLPGTSARSIGITGRRAEVASLVVAMVGNMMLGDLMRRGRERQGWRLARAAWIADVTPARLRQIEDGAWPTSDEFKRLSDLYGWPKSYWPPRRSRAG
jgi:hypothetical protein